MYAGEHDDDLVADIGGLRDQRTEVFGFSTLHVAEHEAAGVKRLRPGLARIFEVREDSVGVIVRRGYGLWAAPNLIEEIAPLPGPVIAARGLPFGEPRLRAALGRDAADAFDLLGRVLRVECPDSVPHLS